MRYYIILSFLSFGLLSSCSRVDRDLDVICLVANKITSDSSITPSEKPRLFIQEVVKADLDKNTKIFFHELSQASEVKYEFFEIFAEDNNINDWNCESLKILLQN